MHSGQEDDPLVFLWSNGQQSETVGILKGVLKYSFICFRENGVLNAGFVLFHHVNRSDLAGFKLHGQSN